MQIGWGGKIMFFADGLATTKIFGELIGMTMWDCHVVIQTNTKLFHLEQFVDIWYLSSQAKFGQGNLLYIIKCKCRWVYNRNECPDNFHSLS